MNRPESDSLAGLIEHFLDEQLEKSPALQDLARHLAMPGPTLRTGQMATIDVDEDITPGECRLVDLHRYEPALAS